MSTRTRRLGRRSPAASAILYVIIAGIAVISLFPFFWMVVTSIKPDTAIFTRTPQFFPAHAIVSRYGDLLSGPIPRQFLNSLIVAGATTVLTGVIALMAGYALARYKVPMRRYLLVVILSMQMLPQTILVIPLFVLRATDTCSTRSRDW